KIWKTYIHHLYEVPPRYSTKSYFRQPGHSFTPIPDEPDITLEGYFQSGHYLYGYKEQLAQSLGFKYEPADYVVVHVRRGDYLLYPDRFPALPKEYYHAGLMNLMNKGYRNYRFYSDDIAWCGENFP